MTGWNVRENIRKLKDISTLGVTDTAANAISAFFWFYLAALLGETQYGQISHVLAITGLASTIAMLGSENTLMVYPAKNVKIQSTIYLITGISGIITAITVFALYNNIESSVLVVGYVIFGLASHEILGRKLYQDYAKLLIIQRVLMIGLCIGLYHALGLNGVILGLGLAYFPYLIRIYRGFKECKIEFGLLKTRHKFMANSYLTRVTDTLGSSTDRLIIAPMFGYALLGNYQLGLQFLALLDVLPAIVYKYTLPHDSSGNPNIKLKKITVVISTIIASLTIILAPLVIPAIFPKFNAAIEIIQILSISIIPASIAYAYTSRLLGSEKSKIVLIGYVLYLLVLVAGIITLGSVFGINGAAISMVIATTSQTIFLVTLSRYDVKHV
jgi:O-antigen/teichoic acid export membrane protein